MSLLFTSSVAFILLQFFISAQEVKQTELDIRYCNNGCSEYFNGCNDCTCNSDGTSVCTDNHCETMSMEHHCNQCKRNTHKWTDCGSCERTCDNYKTMGCIQECQEKCDCPLNLPLWDEKTNQCIAESDCNKEIDIEPDNGSSNTLTAFTQSISVPDINLIDYYCGHGALSYFDGCNVCKCITNTTSVCDTTNCEVTGTHYCLACSSNLEWNECGSECLPTCEIPIPQCITECQSRCYCPKDTVWNGFECVTEINCKIKTASVCSCETTSTASKSQYTRSSIYCREQKQETDCNLRICTWKCN